jgi:hypothetical protein
MSDTDEQPSNAEYRFGEFHGNNPSGLPRSAVTSPPLVSVNSLPPSPSLAPNPRFTQPQPATFTQPQPATFTQPQPATFTPPQPVTPRKPRTKKTTATDKDPVDITKIRCSKI